mgnify:CR=1 FL=1
MRTMTLSLIASLGLLLGAPALASAQHYGTTGHPFSGTPSSAGVGVRGGGYGYAKAGRYYGGFGRGYNRGYYNRGYYGRGYRPYYNRGWGGYNRPYYYGGYRSYYRPYYYGGYYSYPGYYYYGYRNPYWYWY